MSGLTRKQYDCLMFTHERIRETGIPPSFDELKGALDLKSKSGIHRLIVALEERGYIRRMEKRARAIEVIKLPDNFAGRQAPARSRSEVQRRAFESRVPESFGDTHALNVPLVGRIGAVGTRIEALQNKVADVVVGVGMIGRGNHYALEVTGDSMINAGIIDGDTVIIQETDKVTTGEIAIVLIDGERAYLRRLRLRGDSIALEAYNPAYETHLYYASRVAIQGRLVGLVRRY
jgi:repressor LexA